MARTKAAGASAKDALVEQAQRALLANTFDSEALSALAQRASVSQPLLHYHFGSREELWREAVVRAFAPLEAAFGGELEALASLGPRERLEVVVRRFVAFSAAQPVVAAVIVTESMRPGPRLKWLVKNHLAPLHRAVDAIILEGTQLGVFRAVAPIHITQIIVPAAAFFFTARPLIEQLYEVDVEALVKSHTDELVKLVLRGLEPLTPKEHHHG